MDSSAAIGTGGLDFRGKPAVAMDVLAAGLFRNGHKTLEILRRELPALKPFAAQAGDDHGEMVISGEQAREVLVLARIHHSAMDPTAFADSAVLTALAKWLESQPRRRYTYRLAFVPDRLSVVHLLSGNLEMLVAGFDVAGIAAGRVNAALPTQIARSLSERVAAHALRHQTGDLPSNGPSDLGAAFARVCTAVRVVEANATFLATTPCEPNLGKRGLYPTVSTKDTKRRVRSMMNVLAYADGAHDLLAVADMLEVPVWDLVPIAETLEQHGLLQRVEDRHREAVHGR